MYRSLHPLQAARDRAGSPLAGLTLAGALITAGLSGTARGSGGETADQLFEAGRAQIVRNEQLQPIRSRARNVILFVGDGMSVATVTAARIYEGQSRPGNRGGEENVLSFERFPYVALSKTYQTNQQVPDSAPTMTALVTGMKTGEAMLSVAPSVALGDHAAAVRTENQLLTILERAERRGMATGIVTTTRITHATPAACYAHTPHRGWESDATLSGGARAAGFPDIARQLVEFPYWKGLAVGGDGIEVALGGGRAAFRPKGAADPEQGGGPGARVDGRDLTREWVAGTHRPGGRTGAYVTTSAELRALLPDGGPQGTAELTIGSGNLNADRKPPIGAGTKRRVLPPVLGLFESSHMKYEADRAKDAGGEPSLAEMTRFAIAALSASSKGYFLMVEGGRIDHAHHAGNAYRALTDTVAFADAVRVAAEVTDPKDTLIIVTADHSHVFTIAGYARRGNPILGLVVANHEDSEAAGGTSDPDHGFTSVDLLGRPYTTLGYQNGPGYTGESLSSTGADTSGKAPTLQAEGPKRFPHAPARYAPPGITKGRPDLSRVDTTDPNYLQEAAVPLDSETHGGEDVPVYARGPKAYLIAGVLEQNAIYHVMAAALGFDGRR